MSHLGGGDGCLDLLHGLAVAVLVLKHVAIQVVRHGDRRMPHHSLHALGCPAEVGDEQRSSRVAQHVEAIPRSTVLIGKSTFDLQRLPDQRVDIRHGPNPAGAVGEEEHVGQRPEESADIAAIAADNFRRHLDLRAHFKSMKAARAAQA